MQKKGDSMHVTRERSRAGLVLLGGAVALALGGTARAQSATAKPDPVKFPACIQKANDKYTGGDDLTKGCFAKLEAKGTSQPCLTHTDSDSIFTSSTGIAGAVRFALDAAAPPSTLSKCTSGQEKCVANLAKALLGCDGKNNGKPDAVALSTCITKAETKYTGGADLTKGCFAKLEAKMPNDCVTTGN